MDNKNLTIVNKSTVGEIVDEMSILNTLLDTKLNDSLIQGLKDLVKELNESSEQTLDFLKMSKKLQKILDEQFTNFQHNDTILKMYLNNLDTTVDKAKESLNNTLDKANTNLSDTIKKTNEDLKEKYKSIDMEILSEKGKIAKFLADEQNVVTKKLKKELDETVELIDKKMILFKKDIKIDKENRAKPLKIINYANMAIGGGLGLALGVLGTFFILSSHLVK